METRKAIETMNVANGEVAEMSPIPNDATVKCSHITPAGNIAILIESKELRPVPVGDVVPILEINCTVRREPVSTE